MTGTIGKKVAAPLRQNGPMLEPLAINEYEAARILAKSVQSLRNERHLRKGCPYIKIGKCVRYLLSDLIDYLNENRIDPEKISE
jgi:hypothetical protein